MSKSCNDIQEKLACAISLDLEDHKHLVACQYCQAVFADLQVLNTFLDEEDSKIEVLDGFSNKVMMSIEQLTSEEDWFDRLLGKFNRLIEIPLFQYGSLVSGFGLGLLTFIRFVAFVFIPA